MFAKHLYVLFSKSFVVLLEVLVLFPILGILLINPVNSQEENMAIEKWVDKEDVQRDKPVEGERDVTYTIELTTNGYCNADLDLSIVFDKSGSMIAHMGLTKQATESFINELDSETDQISLVSYNSEATLDQGLTNDFQSVIDSVYDLNAQGYTNIGDALSTADQELYDNGREESQKVILIFTDGQHNYPTEDDEEVYNIADSIKEDHGIRIISVGIGDDIDAVFLETIASSLEDYYWVENTSELEETFIEIARGLQFGEADIGIEDDIADLLEHVDFVSASDEGYLDGDKLKWDFGFDICLEGSRTVSFVVRVKPDTPDITELLNTAAAIDFGNDIEIISNEVDTIVHAPILEIDKVCVNDYVLEGEDIAYQIRIRNIGTGNAYGVELIDKFPSQFISINESSISDDGYIAGSTIVWDNNGNGFILNGEFDPEAGSDALGVEHIFAYEAQLNADASSGDNIVNTAIVSSAGVEEDVESTSAIKVSAILAVTGQNVTKLYPILIFCFGVFAVFVQKKKIFR